METDTARRRARLAGAVAAAAALAVTEVVAATNGASLLEVIGTQFINRFAAPLKDLAVAVFGTNDKVALEIGIVVVALAVGSSLGAAALRRRQVATIGFAAFGLVGFAAGLSDPLASKAGIGFGAVLGVAAGIGVSWVLLQRVDAASPTAPVAASMDDPRVRAGSRRAFLGLVGAAGGASLLAGGIARVVRDAAGDVAARVLPRARRVTPVPASQPFAVDGLSAYVTPNADFYRIDTALFVPRVNVDRWTLEVSGLVDKPFRVTYDELLAMDLVEEPVTLQCVSNEVGGSLVGTASWLGVPLAGLLERAKPRREATQIVGRSVDNFTVGFPTAVGLDGRTALVAVGMNGEVLPQRHGYPARLVVAGLYGYVSATKWLRQIELTRLEDFDAYWIPRGWAKEAPIKTASRIDVPRKGARLVSGRVPIAGVAWAPNRGIASVQVRVDDGSWIEAQLGDVASDDTWVQWLYEWDATPGDHKVAVRAVDKHGDVQTSNETPPRPDGATGYHTRSVTVR
ncbi:MAG TPA: molybdopterin-dependent oxidoreductase [Mycobacterium sp.]|nr:molybdopterin-dependent oxidoreductase [Mycobacterium sp.]